MNIEDIHQLLVDQFGTDVVTALVTESKDPWIEVAPESIQDVTAFIKNDDRLRFDHLTNLCGVDYFEPDAKKQAKFGHDPHIEVVYHLYSYNHKHSLVLKVKLPRWKDDNEGELPEVPSVSSIWASADWHERETYDLMGIRFLNHPNLRRILCPEDWEGHPLRKDYDFPLEYHGIRGR